MNVTMEELQKQAKVKAWDYSREHGIAYRKHTLKLEEEANIKIAEAYYQGYLQAVIDAGVTTT